MEQIQFVNNEVYQIYNRGVDKRSIVLDDKDRFRFIHDLFEFNDQNPSPPSTLKIKKSAIQTLEVRLPKFEREPSREPRKLLVEILAFCLMDNHYHLLIKQKLYGGVTLFLRKLGTGYTNYFNQRYERSGVLFQGRFKAIHISEEAHFIYLPYYIHFNPLDFIIPAWREGEIINSKKAIAFLENYRWSSYLDYIGRCNFPSVTQRKFLLEVFGGEEKYKESVAQYLKDIDFQRMKDVVME